MTRSERIAWFVGEVARPWCLIAAGTAFAWTVFDGKDAAIITAGGVILLGLYGAKAAEVAFGAKKTADVQVAQSGAGEPTTVTVETDTVEVNQK